MSSYKYGQDHLLGRLQSADELTGSLAFEHMLKVHIFELSHSPVVGLLRFHPDDGKVAENLWWISSVYWREVGFLAKLASLQILRVPRWLIPLPEFSPAGQRSLSSCEMSQHLLDGLAQNLVRTFVFPSGWTLTFPAAPSSGRHFTVSNTLVEAQSKQGFWS